MNVCVLGEDDASTVNLISANGKSRENVLARNSKLPTIEFPSRETPSPSPSACVWFITVSICFPASRYNNERLKGVGGGYTFMYGGSVGDGYDSRGKLQSTDVRLRGESRFKCWRVHGSCCANFDALIEHPRWKFAMKGVSSMRCYSFLYAFECTILTGGCVMNSFKLYLELFSAVGLALLERKASW